jgi:hypothetical protein
MKKMLIFLLLNAIMISCNYNNKSVKVFIENSSDVNPEVNIEIYSNNKFLRKEVVRISNTVNFTVFDIKSIPDSLILKFILLETKEETGCMVLKTNIHNKYASVHVNFSEVLFKNGDIYKSVKLNKDSIVKRIFYSEIMY